MRHALFKIYLHVYNNHIASWGQTVPREPEAKFDRTSEPFCCVFSTSNFDQFGNFEPKNHHNRCPSYPSYQICAKTNLTEYRFG